MLDKPIFNHRGFTKFYYKFVINITPVKKGYALNLKYMPTINVCAEHHIHLLEGQRI